MTKEQAKQVKAFCKANPNDNLCKRIEEKKKQISDAEKEMAHAQGYYSQQTDKLEEERNKELANRENHLIGLGMELFDLNFLVLERMKKAGK